jgi:hypothetical protein
VSTRSQLARGVLVGITATGVMSVLEPLEWRWLGRRPGYVPSRIARAAAARAGRRLEAGAAHRAGLVMRWAYGSLLGVAFVRWRIARRIGVAPGGLLAGAAIAAFEIPALAAIGAAPRPRDWPREEVAALLQHTLVWGLAAAATDLLTTPRR